MVNFDVVVQQFEDERPASPWGGSRQLPQKLEIFKIVAYRCSPGNEDVAKVLHEMESSPPNEHAYFFGRANEIADEWCKFLQGERRPVEIYRIKNQPRVWERLR